MAQEPVTNRQRKLGVLGRNDAAPLLEGTMVYTTVSWPTSIDAHERQYFWRHAQEAMKRENSVLLVFHLPKQYLGRVKTLASFLC